MTQSFSVILFATIVYLSSADLISQSVLEFNPFQKISAASVAQTTLSAKASSVFFTELERTTVAHLRGKRDYTDENFDEFLRQKITGNRIPQCPCVINPGSGRCIAYDSRFQAASIEEAIVSFRDLTLDQQRFEDELYNATTYECQTLECQTCTAIIVNRLREIGFISADQNINLPFPTQYNPADCKRLRIASSQMVIPPPTEVPSYVDELIRNGLRRIRSEEFENPPVAEPPISPIQLIPSEPTRTLQRVFLPAVLPQQQFVSAESQFQASQPQFQPSQQLQFQPSQQPLLVQRSRPFDLRDFILQEKIRKFNAISKLNDQMMQVLQNLIVTPFLPRRKKRQANSKRKLGKSFDISCVKRGEPADSNFSDLLSLCSACWTWRQLPEDYFPRIINEVSCSNEKSEKYCLSGWGSCNQQFQNFDILQKVDDGWKPTTISITNYCDCKVKAGSEIHSLVVGKA